MKRIILIISFFIVSTSFSQFSQIEKLLDEKPKSFYDFFNQAVKIQSINEQKYDDLQKLIKLSEQKDYPIAKIYALDIIATKYRRELNYEKSIEYHKKAINLSQKTKNTEAEVVSLNMLGLCYRWKLDIRNAVDYHQQVLNIASKFKTQSKSLSFTIGIALNSVGEIYKELKQYDLAINQFKEAIRIHQKIDNNEGLAINHFCLGEAYVGLGKLDTAMEHFQESLKYNKIVKSKLERILCYDQIANVYIIEKEYKKAYDTLEEIYFDALSLENPTHLAKIKSTLGRIQTFTDDLDAAEINLLEAYRLYNSLDIKNSNFSKVCFYLSELYDKKGDIKDAFSYYKKGVNITEKTLGQQNILYIGKLINKYDSQSKKLQIKQLETKAKQKEFESSRIRTILIIILISLALLGIILYSIYRQGLLNSDKKILILEQQALQAQMNPHFIFNALNSIKLYIINNEQRQAVYYLNKFAKLIRNILDTSRKKEVSLTEELETMELYVTIENIRFNNEIEYTCEVKDESLNLDTIKIPPLLLQPFLENAIWHGLASKKEDKRVNLTIDATENDKSVLISIIDSGVGREAAMAIKKAKSLNRKSVGIDLTEERLKTFADDYIEEAYVKYTDLKDEQGNAKGTEVVLKIPIY